MCSYATISSNKHQVMKMGEKLQGLQEEKHQLFLQLKKVLHEEEKRRRKEQRFIYIYTSLSLLFCQRIVNCRLSFLVSLFSDITTLTSASYQQSLPMHPGQHLLGIQGEKSSRFCALPESSLFFIWWHSPFLSFRQSSQPQQTWPTARRKEQTAVPSCCPPCE